MAKWTLSQDHFPGKLCAMATATASANSVGDRRLGAVRAGLGLLALGQGIAAVWALADPRSFYGDFPTKGQHWVSSFAPYNEHLVRDYGAAFLALCVLALIAAWLADRRLMVVALIVWVVGAVPHLVFHAVHAGTTGALSLATLAVNVAFPLVLLALVPKEIRR
jgi:hypothetical protein